MLRKIQLITLPILLFFSFTIQAQLNPGDTAPDWTLTDIDGNTHHLYDILDQGKNVIIDFSATWCGPCWSFHNSGVLEHLYETYGPDGTNELMVFFIEGDVNTTSADLHGTGNNTFGDWVTGTPYPIIDITSQQILIDYKLPYWPTVYTICNDRKIKVQGRFSVAGFESHLSGCPDAVSLIELTNTEIVNASCSSSEDGSISLTIEGPNPPFTVYWNNGSNSNGTLSNIGHGTYNATIIDQSGGFLEVGPFQVGYESEGVSGGVANIQPASCTEGLGSIDIEITAGTAESFLWSNGATTEDVDNLSPGTYSVVITGNGGCEQIIDDIVVEGANVPSINLNSTGQLSCLEPSIELNATNSAAEDGDEIIWTTADGSIVSGSTTLNPSVDSEGTYTLTITNQAGCSAQSSIFIQNPEVPNVNIAETDELTCSVACIILDATNSSSGDNFELNWTSTDGAIVEGISTLNPMICQPGTYTLMITNTENGCSQDATIVINANEDIPDVNIDGPTELNCNISSIELSAYASNTDLSYSWTNSNGMEISTENNAIVTENGIYTLVVNDPSNGCSSSDEIEIQENFSTPTITEISASNDISCSQNSATINVNSSNTNNATYFWTSPSGEITESNTSNLEVSSAGVYQLTLENENGCSTSTEIEVIGSSDTPQAFASSGTISCQVTEISLSGSSNFENVSYEWTGPNGFTSNDQNPIVTISGEYILTVIAANGCSSSTTTTVEGDTETPQITSISGFSNCNEYGLQIEAVGNNLTFSWTGPNGFTSNEQNPEITESIEGEFTCIVTNEYGCSTEVNTTVEDNSDIPSIMDAVGVVNCNTSSLMIQVDGDPTSYTYSWTGPNGFTSNEQNPEIDYQSGVYTCVVTSSTGCQVSTEAEVTVDQEEPQIEISYSNDIDCDNTTASINVNEFQENLSYQWNGPNDFSSSTANLEVNAGGEYELIVTNPDNGCASTKIITIEENTDPVFIELNNESISCDIASISLPPSIDGQDVSWKNEQEMQVSENATESGNYTGTFINSYGCEGTVSITIEDDTAKPEFELTGTKITCANEFAILKVESQTEIRSVAWSGPGITPANKYQTNPEVTIGGVYSAKVTGVNGCAESKDKEIEAEPKLDIEILAITNISCFGESDGKVEFDLITGTPPLEYNFDFEKELSKGSYFAKVTDANGCEDELSFTIIEPDPLKVSFADIKNATDSKLGSAIAFGIGGTAPFTFLWSDGSTNEKNEALGAGIHSVTITDVNGCTQEGEITIEKSTQLNDIENLTGFEIAPNPSAGIFTLQLKFEKTSSFKIEVISLLGSQIYSETFSDELNLNKVFDLSHLQSGAYLLKVINDNGEQAIRKISILK